MTKPKDKLYNFTGAGLTDEEKKWARNRFEDYREAYPYLNKLSNLQVLETLVWKEAMLERFQKQIGETAIMQAPKKDGKVVAQPIPSHLEDSVNDSLTHILELKTKLGMFEDQKVLDAFKDFQSLKEKAIEYRKTHPLSFKCTCPFCARQFALKRRTENFQEFISPFLEDKIINNRPLFKLYKDGKVTKEDIANVLGVSPDYIDWLDEKVYGNVKKQIQPETPQTPTT